MTKAIRWIIRLVSLAILAGVWSVLPLVMAGPSRLLSLVHLVCLVIAVDCGVIMLLGTFVPSSDTRLPSRSAPTRPPDAEELRRAALRVEQQQGERHDR